jgi:hypothetical protein
LNEIVGYNILATDGVAGTTGDLLVDRVGWIVRYLVVNAGEWLPERKILIHPAALGQPDWAGRSLPVNLSREKIQSSPSLSHDEPILRNYESLLHEHYGWRPYWLAKIPGDRPVGPTIQTDIPPEPSEAESNTEPSSDISSQLSSANEINGFELKTGDGEYGQVFDVLVDDTDWVVRYLCVKLRRIVPEKAVLVPYTIVEDVLWDRSRVEVNVSVDTFIRAPEYDASRPVDANYESVLVEYYERTKSRA